MSFRFNGRVYESSVRETKEEQESRLKKHKEIADKLHEQSMQNALESRRRYEERMSNNKKVGE